MKKTLILPLIFASIAFFSCSKENLSAQKTGNTQQNTTTTDLSKIRNPGAVIFASCGTWDVNSLMANGVDETAAYSNVNLTICPDNTFTVSNDIMAVNGKWFFGTVNDNVLYFHMDFNSTNETWADLQATWKVNTIQQNKLIMQTDDGSKTLTLQRHIIK